jgi:putative FmdB family regulatory protein
MPQYDYGCPSCGPFTLSRPMAKYDQPQSCPRCGEAAPRALLTGPAIGGMSSAGAASEGRANAQGRWHPSGCGCCRPTRLKAEAAAPSGQSG